MSVILKNANVLSLKSDVISYATDIRIVDEIIAEIGKNLTDDNGNTIECNGMYAMPALFDSHVHLNTNEMGKLFLANGITSVRNLCGTKRHLQIDADVRARKCIGPYIYSSSPIYDSVDASNHLEGHVYIKTEEEAEQAVYDSIKAGFRWVKTYPHLSEKQLKRMLDTAKAAGIKACGHMSYNVDAKFLCDWGYHCVEHSSSLPPHPNDIAYLAQQGMWFCPTQVVCETLPDYVWEGKKLEDITYYEYVPQPVREYWEKKNKLIIEGYKNRGLRPNIQTIINRGRIFMKHSDRYLAGSDAFYPGMVAGFSLHDELERLVNLYGCSNYEALKASTVNPANYMELEKEKGYLLPGMDADILLLTENPLLDIKNTRKIHAVIQAGVFYDRLQLDEMLEDVRTMPADKLEFIAPLL